MSELEAILTKAFAEQALHYAAAFDVVEKLTLALEQGGAGDGEVEQLMFRLQQIREIDARIVETKTAWRSSNNESGPELSTAISGVADLIQNLMTRLQKAEQSAKSRHQGLLQGLDDLARGKHMQRAYEAVRTFTDHAA